MDQNQSPQPSLGESIKPTPIPVENMKVTIQPKKNCKKCYGLGRIGFIDGDENNPLICQCVIKIYKEIQAKMKAAQPPSTGPTGYQGATSEGITGEGAKPAPIECVNSANDQPKPPAIT